MSPLPSLPCWLCCCALAWCLKCEWMNAERHVGWNQMVDSLLTSFARCRRRSRKTKKPDSLLTTLFARNSAVVATEAWTDEPTRLKVFYWCTSPLWLNEALKDATLSSPETGPTVTWRYDTFSCRVQQVTYKKKVLIQHTARLFKMLPETLSLFMILVVVVDFWTLQNNLCLNVFLSHILPVLIVYFLPQLLPVSSHSKPFIVIIIIIIVTAMIDMKWILLHTSNQWSLSSPAGFILPLSGTVKRVHVFRTGFWCHKVFKW